MTHLPQLSTHDVHIHTPLGRVLFHDLNLHVGIGDRVAIIGRNGAGKTTLLRVLMGELPAKRGRIQCTGSREFVPQLCEGDTNLSPGEQRQHALRQAFEQAPDFLLLDEPSLDLDETASQWLHAAIERHQGACLLVSHDRRLLRGFKDFFVVSESGCHHHHGSFDSLLDALSVQQEQRERNYVKELIHHDHQEAEHVRIARSRERKKNLGRVRELKRCPARARLNAKRSYAQVSQTRRAKVQEKHIGAAREWVKAVRRSLVVQLPLEVTLPELPPASAEPVIETRGLRAQLPTGVITQPIDLCVSRERVALLGPNGAGKTSVLQTLLGERPNSKGYLRTALGKVGYIAQNASNWQKLGSLLEELCFGAEDLERAARVVSAHRFPVALAQRPLVSLSPGERVRAALLALFERRPAVELLVLDEPTNHLDLMATRDLERILRAWPGGLLVVSHDREFLRNIGVTEVVHTVATRRDVT